MLVLAGASPLGWHSAMLATAIGSVPLCLLYAWAGAASTGFEGGAVVFGLTLVLAAIVGLTVRRIERSRLGSGRPVEADPAVSVRDARHQHR
jgi:uncharacterized membrane protein YdjX (TVP38/TMEM64 family)